MIVRRVLLSIAVCVVAMTVGVVSGQAWAQEHPLAPALMPLPAHVSYQGGVLPFHGKFDVQWDGTPDAFLSQAVARFDADARRLTGIHAVGGGTALHIACCTKPVKIGEPDLTVADESYHLTVDQAGISLSAATELGVLRGLATLRQLIVWDKDGPGIRLADVQDTPRFAWRGLLIDAARYFQPIPVLKRQIDAMELTKLNVLHLHLSDNEAFRFQSRRYPELTQATHGEFYTQEQLADLVAYARDRGVSVVPEIDVPGHALAIVTAYPQYASGPLPAGSMGGAAIDVTKPETYTFLDRLLGEVAAVFPASYFHIGGDEVSGQDWMANKDIQGFMQRHGLATTQQLQEYFFLKVHALLARHGKQAIGWEEVATGDTPKDVLVQAWRSSNAIYAATARGNRVIVSAGYYLDYLLPTSAYYAVDPLDAAGAGIDPAIYAEIQKKYQFLLPYFPQRDVKNPALKLNDAQQQLVIGGEGVLWTELVPDDMLDGRLWPRMAGLAERFWSPASVTEVPDMVRRLIVVQDELRVLGLDDDADRERMLARLAPGDADVLMTFTNTVAPVRNFAHMHKLIDFVHHRPPGAQFFNEAADAAFPDNVVTDGFTIAASDFAHGDHSQGDALKAELSQWRDNHARLLGVIQRYPRLQTLMPISADVSALASVGIDAIDMINTHRAPSQAWLSHAHGLIARQDAALQASSSLFATIVSPEQPPEDLLITIVPGVKQLVDAAAKTQ
ncbi:beta-N-acetylhexosaminidase [Dyella flava]|uniref:N-acetyl-beta-glucosaminidase n=1 Tax=Dyella flava TaxID=1920170 RepID=A0ABS2K049_9GAMM|nr:family 20 glycosylhydrolase [Dyella flava]MBM7124430.1 family 20 glycosylhydrolase [Dyella flava]GLQ51909.1 hypothetical protein GCM10010872_33580 [Dyella flava]